MIPQTTAILNIKLPILKKEEYDIWAMEMEHYLEYIDNEVWKRKAKNILLMAIPKEHMRRFHGMDDAKEIWEAIRTRFGGNANSKKMQKAVFKQQFEAFKISNSEGLEKGYDRFQQLLSQLEAHGAEVSTEDANHKFLRSLPPAWSNLAMTMRTNPEIDNLSIDDLYNNLRVFEQEIQGASKTSSSAQNVAFVSQSKSSTNKVKSGFSGAYSSCTPSTSSTNIPEKEVFAGYNVQPKGRHMMERRREIFINIKNAGMQEKESVGFADLCDQEAQILAYSQAVKKLEAQLVTFQKQQFSLNEKLHFRLMKYMKKMKKALKDIGRNRNELSWKDSSKNLWRLINSGMSSNDKLGLGFEIQSNDEVLSFEEEMNFSVFKCSKEDSIGKPSYSRFTKTNEFKGVPPPLSGDYTPIPQEEIDDSLYVYGKKGPQKPETSVSDDNSSEHSTCQSNDSGGSCGNTSEHSFETESESLSEPNEMSKSRLEVTNEKDVSAPKSKEVEPSCVSHIKTPRQPLKDKETHKVNRKNWNDMMERELGEGYSFTKKKCFVCGSLNHLIKDCDYYEKKMAREAEVKRVVNTVQINAGRPKFNYVRPNINTGRTNINSVRPKVNVVSPNVNTVNPKVNTVRPRQPVSSKTSNSTRRDFSKSYSSVRRPFAKSTAQMANSNAVMGSWGSAVKTSASYNWRNSRPNFNYNSAPTFIRTEHPLKNMVDRGIFDSGCSGHMTGNKDQLEDFEEFNGKSVTFGGSKGYISGKGRIRVALLLEIAKVMKSFEREMMVEIRP
ncbi:hypothetical protein Tco_0538477 [Tanacetum coccineum]